jgi:hypothetical protein
MIMACCGGQCGGTAKRGGTGGAIAGAGLIVAAVALVGIKGMGGTHEPEKESMSKEPV